MNSEHHPKAISQILTELPKADLHVHLEGTVTFPLLEKLCRRNNIDLLAPVILPKVTIQPPNSLDKGEFIFNDFKDFIGIYAKIAESICTTEDILEVAKDYLRSAQKQNIVYSEVYFSPSTFLLLGKNLKPLFAGLLEAERLARDYNTKLGWIFDVVRNSETDGMATLKSAIEARSLGINIKALGLAGYEAARPARDFITVFDKARSERFSVLAHAGETSGAESVIETLDSLNPERIGHGVRALESPACIKRLQELQTPLEVSPWSNICLKIYPEDSHPLAQMLQAGLNVVLCSDDPGMFGKNLTDNFIWAYEHQVGIDVLKRLAERSVEIAILR